MRLCRAISFSRSSRRGSIEFAVRIFHGRAWTLLLVLLVGLPAASHAISGEIVVGAAASLRAPVEEMVRDFETDHPGTRVRVVFGASSSIARQIEFGAPIGLYLSADTDWVSYLVNRSLVEEGAPFELASNRLVVVKRKGSSLILNTSSDLGLPAISRVALPPASVPLGRYAREWLEGEGLAKSVESRMVVTEHAQATLAAVENGHSDIAIVYETDAIRSEKTEVLYEIPLRDQPRIVYSATRVGLSPPTEEESAWIDYLKSPRARTILEEAGFGPVIPPDRSGDP